MEIVVWIVMQLALFGGLLWFVARGVTGKWALRGAQHPRAKRGNCMNYARSVPGR